MDITFYLKEPKSTSPTSIYFSLYCDDGRIRKSTGTTILPGFWEEGWFKNLPRNKEVASKKSEVESIKKKLEKHLSNCSLHDQPVLIGEIESLLSVRVAMQKDTFILLYEQLITEAEEGKLLKRRKPKGRYTPGAIKIMKLNKGLLQKFKHATGISLEPSKINAATVQSFTYWMNSRPKASLNYVSTMIEMWRNILDIMKEKGVHNNPFIRDKAFIPTFEVVDKIKLSESDVEIILKLDLSNNPLQEACRDRWVLMFATGLRVSDNRRLSLDHLGKESITLINQKSGKKVVIPYHWMAKEILERYKGELPPNKWPGVINDEMKKVALAAGFTGKFTYKITRKGITREETKFQWELFTNHTSRRSMTTHLIRNGVSHDLGGDMMGMSPQTWARYNKLTPEDKAEVLKDLDVFKKRGTG